MGGEIVEASLLRGRAWTFGDDISTDHIAPGRLFHLRTDLPELATHVMEDADPGFAAAMSAGDFIVGGRNFGLGSSREHAPRIIKLAGVGAVLAQSFARIYFRNSINNGLLALVCDTSGIKDGDQLEIDVDTGVIRDMTRGIEVESSPLPKVMLDILDEGGLVEYMKRHGRLTLETGGV